jgi:hypothetical protein
LGGPVGLLVGLAVIFITTAITVAVGILTAHHVKGKTPCNGGSYYVLLRQPDGTFKSTLWNGDTAILPPVE